MKIELNKLSTIDFKKVSKKELIDIIFDLNAELKKEEVEHSISKTLLHHSNCDKAKYLKTLNKLADFMLLEKCDTKNWAIVYREIREAVSEH